MHCFHLIECASKDWRKTLVGATKVGPQGVATNRWKFVSNQDRRRRRCRTERDIGMPLRVLAAFCSIKFKNLRMIGMSRNNGMSRRRFANCSCECDLLGVGEELLAKDEKQICFELVEHPIAIALDVDS